MKFDVIIGNPPYQEEGKSTRAEPIYNYFMDNSYNLAEKVCFITPGRFLFNIGQTPTSWNKKMLNDPHFKVTHYEQNSSKIFPNTDIKGGLAVTYRDVNKTYKPIELFIPNIILKSIYERVSKYSSTKSISEIVHSSMSYKYSELLFSTYPLEAKKLSGNAIRTNTFDTIPEIYHETQPDNTEEYIAVAGRQKNNRVIKYTKRAFINDHENLENYKVLVPKSNGSGAIGEVLSTPIIGTPMMAHTQTFISIGAFDTEYEAQSALKYVKSKFARTMLGTLKITQDNPRSTWKNVPLQDFTENSDINWRKSIPEIDQQLYKKYQLSKEEINFIETNVQIME